MALEFFTSFEYDTADLVSPTRFNASLNVTYTGQAKSGLRSLQCTAASQASSKLGLAQLPTRIFGFDFLWTGTERRSFLSCLDNVTPQVGLMLDTNGQLIAVRGGLINGFDGTPLGNSGTNLMVTNHWYQITMEVTIDPTAGVFKVYVDNNLWVNVTGANTRTTGNTYQDGFTLGGTNGALYIDNFYCLNTTGGIRTTRITGYKMITLFCTPGNGANVGFTPSTGADRGAMVDDALPDRGTTYNRSTVAGNKDTYLHGPMNNNNGAIFGVQVAPFLQQGGGADAQAIIRTGTTDNLGPTFSVTGTYGYQAHGIWERNPSTSADWTEAQVDATEVGVRHTS